MTISLIDLDTDGSKPPCYLVAWHGFAQPTSASCMPLQMRRIAARLLPDTFMFSPRFMPRWRGLITDGEMADMVSNSSLQNRYDGLTITFHWLTALLVVCLWLIGQLVDFIPRGPLRSDAWSTHVVLGFTLAAVLVIRIVWRLTAARHLPPAHAGFFGLVATLGHLMLYAVLIVVVSLGLADAFVRGYHIFNVVTLPQIGDPELRRPINGWHELAANTIAALALLHAIVALFHHYVLNDRLLVRMGLGRAA